MDTVTIQQYVATHKAQVYPWWGNHVVSSEVRFIILAASSADNLDQSMVNMGGDTTAVPTEERIEVAPPLDEVIHSSDHWHTLGHVRLRDANTNNIILIPPPSLDPNDPLRWYVLFSACGKDFLLTRIQVQSLQDLDCSPCLHGNGHVQLHGCWSYHRHGLCRGVILPH